MQTQLAARTRARHAEVHALAAQGLGSYRIGKRLNLDPKTVRRYLVAADPQQLLGPRAAMRHVLAERRAAVSQLFAVLGAAAAATVETSGLL